ncbi:MAG: carboxylesterase family protein, partial [Lachnospiraceae bacterium]|nr:carboxylesterase family protein [Lachnospiraceae bacterium]
MGKKHTPVSFIIVLTLISVLFFILLEFSKNTVVGWILTAAVITAFIIFHHKAADPAFSGRLNPKTAKMLCWVAFIALLAGIYFLTAPPVRRVPAVEGFGVEKTGVIKVAQGELTGVYNKAHTVEIYAGIPYAQPPVGELRWKEPLEPLPYDGILACDTYGPMAMQSVNSPLYGSLYQILGFHKYNFSLFDNYKEARSEDCLYLNVYRPADYAGEPLPVVFYIHGGSLTTGQSYYTEYRGDNFAEKGVIFVNFAYRLGIFGYMANRELAAESPNGTTGDYGLLDQIAALRWVHENIAAFGGDPDNITIAGESAGSSSVNALCV